jgi:hypothetical protein
MFVHAESTYAGALLRMRRIKSSASASPFHIQRKPLYSHHSAALGGVTILQEPYRLGDTRAVMIEGPTARRSSWLECDSQALRLQQSLQRDEMNVNRLSLPFVPAEAGTQFFG